MGKSDSVCSKEGWNNNLKNEEGEFIPIGFSSGWRVCIDYRKLNEFIRKDHFPLSFLDKMLERIT